MAKVLVLGATSAIAAEAAHIYAARGDTVALVGRSPQKLSSLRERIPDAFVVQADLNDLAAAPNVVESAIAAMGGVDIALVAHGYLGDQLRSEKDFAEAELILRTNLLSPVALLIPLANHMEQQGSGRIGCVTSVAGERGRPRNYTYGSAKGALNVYLQGLRTRLYPRGVSVTTLKLGPVDSPMTADHPKHALFAKPKQVAQDIVTAIDDRSAEAFIPWYWRAIMAGVRGTPEAVFQKLPFLSGR